MPEISFRGSPAVTYRYSDDLDPFVNRDPEFSKWVERFYAVIFHPIDFTIGWAKAGVLDTNAAKSPL